MEARIKEKFIDKINRVVLGTDDIFWENEIKSNILVAATELNLAIVTVIAWILSYVGVFEIESREMMQVAIPVLIELLVPSLLCIFFKGKKKWIKYVMLLELVVVLARVDAFLTYNVTLIIVLPVVLSVRYWSKKLSVIISVLTGAMFFVSAAYGATHGYLDINMVTLPEGTNIFVGSSILSDSIRASGALDMSLQLKNVILMSFLPKLLIFTIVAITCCEIANRGHEMVLEEAAFTKKGARIEAELNLATDIQANMLPTVFPPYPERHEFDIYGIMDPAKEVGGDLFDFYMVDDDHLVITIADVSGKGVPAALFMCTAKTLIKDFAYQGLTTGGIFTKANNILCDGNEAGLFVTAWMAIINIKTGETDFCNAGHNPPLVKHGEEGYGYLKTSPALVLAGMEGIKYKSKHLVLEPGDVLFLYTDGVPEAINNKNEEYGESRLIKTVSDNDANDVQTICRNVKADVDAFAGSIEQFDDITMLALKFYGPEGRKE